jgi:murein L,D-transpeptidase YafK
MRRRVVALVGGLGLIIAILVVWDFVKLGRHVPALAAIENRATSILVEKQARQLTLVHGDKVIKTYRVALGGDPTGPKQREGDSRTPEGDYNIDSKNRRSRFHLALHVSYPSAEDRTRAAQRGVPPGSDIMIHGLPNGLGWLNGVHLFRDWTDGCIAVTDAEIEEIWALVDTGTSVRISP